MTETDQKAAVETPKDTVTVETPPVQETEAEKSDRAVPAVITRGDQYDRAYRYLVARYHVLTPVSAFSGMAPQHGLVTAKVLIDNDPQHGEVYQDKLFCKIGNKDPLDDECAITKVGLRKLALAAGWNLSADVLVAERSYWVVRGYSRFVGLDGAVQTFSATEEYDLRDGSPQVRGWSTAQKEMARAHGLRGAESRALNAACREAGIRQKYTRRELLKAFTVMRMMFIPDRENEMQMRIVTERALQGTSAMFPLHSTSTPIAMEPIEGMSQGGVIDAKPVGSSSSVGAHPVSSEPAAPALPVLPEGYTLIQKVEVEKKKKKGSTDTFDKWHCFDMTGEETVTIKRDIGKALLACWNKDNWKEGRPVEIVSQQNAYREMEITELTPWDGAADQRLPLSEDE